MFPVNEQTASRSPNYRVTAFAALSISFYCGRAPLIKLRLALSEAKDGDGNTRFCVCLELPFIAKKKIEWRKICSITFCLLSGAHLFFCPADKLDFTAAPLQQQIIL